MRLKLLNIILISLFLVGIVSALTGYVDPNADASPNQWTPSAGVNHYATVDDGQRSPAVPADSAYLTTTTNTDNSEVFDMTTIGSVASVSAVKIWVYGNTSYTSAEPVSISIFMGGSWEAPQNINIGTSPGWANVTFAGAWNQADIDALQVNMTENSAQTGYGMQVDGLYGEITYESSGGGGLIPEFGSLIGIIIMLFIIGLVVTYIIKKRR